ncbi:MAG TPA: hypothetical protein VFW66_09700 [Gemmatimonadales bacterium]|nr:hypothetical protein [Gemmatimonadales bacterium]
MNAPTASAQLASPRSASREGVAGVVVFLVACAAYLQTAGYGFTYDDVPVIARRDLFHAIGRWREILAAPWWANHMLYRPLTALTFALDWTAGGGNPHLFHATNIVLHGLTTVLVFVLARRLLGMGPGVVAALLFAVHPVHVEAVANVVGRAEILATAFTLIAVLAYQTDGALAAGGDHASWHRYAATLATIASVPLALGSKESAFALPGLLLLVDWLDAGAAGEPFADRVRRHSLLWLAVVVAAVGWLVLRAAVVHDITGREVAPGLEGLGLVDRTLAVLPIVVQYVRLLVLPVHLSADYSPDFVRVVPEITPGAMLGAAVLALAAVIAYRARRRAPVVTFGLAWIAGTLLIVANVLVPTGVLLAERTFYLPSVGAVLIGGWLWQRASAAAPAATRVALAAVLVAGVARTVTRNPAWRSNDVLFADIIRTAPGSYQAAWLGALKAVEAGDARRAEALLREAIRINPLGASVWQDLASLEHQERRYAESARNYWVAWTLEHDAPLNARRAIQNWVLAGAVDTAEVHLSEALRALGPGPELRLAAADIALARGNPRRAMTLLRQVAWQFPREPHFWMVTADAALRARDCTELVRATARLRALDPADRDLGRLDRGAADLDCGAGDERVGLRR